MKNFLQVLAIAASVFSISNAQSAEYSSSFNTCVKTSQGGTDALGVCYNAEIKAQDARLNNNYKKTMSVLQGQQKQKLQEAQRLWVKFRDSDCGMYYSLTGGTIDSLNGADCELSTTAKRADDLAWIAENGAQ